MYKVKVKREFFAQRCEICHKSDCFDPEQNSCNRCNQLVIEKIPKETFRINWKINLLLLQHSLRNFSWQNSDSRLFNLLREGTIIATISLIISQLFAYQQTIASLPEPSQTEDYSMWCCCCYCGYTLTDIITIVLGMWIFGIFVGLSIYYLPKLRETLAQMPKAILENDLVEALIGLFE